jgi:hypothetical protein
VPTVSHLLRKIFLFCRGPRNVDNFGHTFAIREQQTTPLSEFQNREGKEKSKVNPAGM